MLPEFTILCGIGLVATIVVALVLKTGLFRTAAFWINYCIILTFEVLIDGWLTKLSAPIVIYDNDFMTNVRFPWDIPVEDFVFGIPMVVIPLMLWVRSSPTVRNGSPTARNGSPTAEHSAEETQEH